MMRIASTEGCVLDGGMTRSDMRADLEPEGGFVCTGVGLAAKIVYLRRAEFMLLARWIRDAYEERETADIPYTGQVGQ